MQLRDGCLLLFTRERRQGRAELPLHRAHQTIESSLEIRQPHPEPNTIELDLDISRSDIVRPDDLGPGGFEKRGEGLLESDGLHL